jgi:hypothetical protein
MQKCRLNLQSRIKLHQSSSHSRKFIHTISHSCKCCKHIIEAYKLSPRQQLYYKEYIKICLKLSTHICLPKVLKKKTLNIAMYTCKGYKFIALLNKSHLWICISRLIKVHYIQFTCCAFHFYFIKGTCKEMYTKHGYKEESAYFKRT